jgi:hypothetical protein
MAMERILEVYVAIIKSLNIIAKNECDILAETLANYLFKYDNLLLIAA